MAGGPLPDVSALYPLLSRVGTLSDRLTDTQSKPARRRRGRDRAAERVSERSDDDELADVEWAPRGWYEGSGAVDALAQHVVGLWRKQFVQAVQRKVRANPRAMMAGAPITTIIRHDRRCTRSSC